MYKQCSDSDNNKTKIPTPVGGFNTLINLGQIDVCNFVIRTRGNERRQLNKRSVVAFASQNYI